MPMWKKVIKYIFLVFVFLGVFWGIYISINRENLKKEEQNKINDIFSKVQNKNAVLTNFYTYGNTLNIEGKISNIAKDNFEGAKIIITDGSYEKSVSINSKFIDNNFVFSTELINDGIELDELELGNYYILLRLKLNNSSVPKLYFLSPNSKISGIEYYTVTNNKENKKINIEISECNINDKNYNYLFVKVMQSELPEDVYDFVIDAGHGGKDEGERSGSKTEANIALEYAKELKAKLEELGLKVKLTRDDQNSSDYNYINMYDENGRISIACKSKAKFMLSFHVNNGKNNLTGVEIYAPTKSNLIFAKLMADNIVSSGAITYSNNTAFKEKDGVYVWNFTKSVINQFEKTAKNKGYEPYNITEETPYQYTIREVGGVATNAYADGRNKTYSKNEYFDSRQGIECYQVELGYIKTDIDKILNNKEAYLSSIVEAIKNYLSL